MFAHTPQSKIRCTSSSGVTRLHETRILNGRYNVRRTRISNELTSANVNTVIYGDGDSCILQCLSFPRTAMYTEKLIANNVVCTERKKKLDSFVDRAFNFDFDGSDCLSSCYQRTFAIRHYAITWRRRYKRPKEIRDKFYAN